MASTIGPKSKGGAVNDNILEVLREWDGRSKNSQEEEKTLQKRFERIQQVHYQEQVVFNQKNEQTQSQIKSIQEELKGLASSVKNLDKEIDKAIEQIPVKPGIYHVNFLEKVRQAIFLLKKRVEDASTWLEAFNQKSAKKHGYWNQFKKSGTQWSLSNERNVATSVG
jgi:predicted RNase H-like nuclease (RuvC/YqgF family)